MRAQERRDAFGRGQRRGLEAGRIIQAFGHGNRLGESVRPRKARRGRAAISIPGNFHAPRFPCPAISMRGNFHRPHAHTGAIATPAFFEAP
jgi:hypothetical protein